MSFPVRSCGRSPDTLFSGGTALTVSLPSAITAKIPPKMNKLTPIIGLSLLLLGGCATPQPQAGIPASHTGPVATLNTYRGSPVDEFAGDEVRCQIQSIDGSDVGADYKLLPGTHRLLVILNHQGKEYVGDANLIIPAARKYQLKATTRADAFMLSIVDEEAAKTIATSTAPVGPHMKFLAFVLQK